MKKRMVNIVIILVLISAMLTGCAGKNNNEVTNNSNSSPESVNSNSGNEADEVAAGTDTEEAIEISFYTTETGKDDLFLDLIEHFEETNKNITVEYIAAGDDQLQKWMSLYASNDGPTVALMDPINIFENQERMKAYNTTECPWLDNVYEDSLSAFTYDGQVYGIPGTAAGFGLLYNQRVLDEAVGGTFDPATIKTRSALKELFDKIESTGVAASMFTGVNWSLGAHYLGMVYGGYRGDVTERVSFAESEKNGTADLANDSVFNAYMDTFDLIAEYNYNKEDPLVGNVNIDAEAFATGKVGTWFMGDWAWTYIAGIDGADSEYGILPIPVSDNEDDLFNTVIPTSYAKGYCIDASQNTESQQMAGQKFVEYLCTDAYAQQEMIAACGQALPYKNCTATVESKLGQATASYIEKGLTYDFYGTADLLPSDFWYENGAYMCEYLAGACDRETLANNIASYWKERN